MLFNKPCETTRTYSNYERITKYSYRANVMDGEVTIMDGGKREPKTVMGWGGNGNGSKS